MGEETVNQAASAPVTATNTQTTASTASVQAVPAAGQAGSAVESGGIVVGNQTFKSHEDLAKAYQESMRGHTQATQKYSKELEAYKSVSDWLGTLKRDPSQWSRFTEYVYGKPNAQQAQGVVQAQPGAAEAASQADPRFDEFRSDLEGRLEAQQTQVEYLTFRHQHPEVQDDLMSRITDQVLKWDDEGKVRSFEEARRWILAEENAAKFVSEGQRQAVEAQAASKAAGGVLGTAPASSSATTKPEPKFRDMKTVKDQNNYLRDMLGRFKPKR